jgi:hypothetical protein
MRAQDMGSAAQAKNKGVIENIAAWHAIRYGRSVNREPGFARIFHVQSFSVAF